MNYENYQIAMHSTMPTLKFSIAPPDFITFLRHHIAHIENQLITPNNWVVLGGASEKHVPL